MTLLARVNVNDTTGTCQSNLEEKRCSIEAGLML